MLNNNLSNKFDFTTVFFLLLLVLKLTHVIDWSWWWVTSPLWFTWVLGLTIIGFVGLIIFSFFIFVCILYILLILLSLF